MGVDKAGNYRDKIFAPETKHVLDFMFKAAQEGYFDPGQMTLDDNGISAAASTVEYFALLGVRLLPNFPKAKWSDLGIAGSDLVKPEHEARCRTEFKDYNWLDADFNFQDGRESGAYCQMA